MESWLDSLVGKLQRHPKRIVFPDGEDPRILQAARQLANYRCAAPILLGDRSRIKESAAKLSIRLDHIRLLEPSRSDDLELFFPMLDETPRWAGLSKDEKVAMLNDAHNFAALMITTGRADALVAGATLRTSSALRSLFRIIPTQDGVKSASSLLLVDREKPAYGPEGRLFFADCGVIPFPSAEQLADIAVATADFAWHLTAEQPRVAFLSYSTGMRTVRDETIHRLREGMAIARERVAGRRLPAVFSGEMQLDAALNPEVAATKGLADDPVAGQANVLIFPNLHAGNVAAKTIQTFTGARTYGQLIMGLSRPCAEISRGALVTDVWGTAVVTAARAVDSALLYGSPPPA